MADPTSDLPPKQRVLVQEKIIKDQKDILSNLKGSIKNLEELLKKEQNSNEEKQNIITQQQNTITEQQATITEQDSIIRDQQVSIVEQQKNLSNANEEINEKNSQLLRINSEWEDQTALLKKKIFNLKEEISSKEEKIENKIKERENKIKELTEKINNLTEELEKFKTEKFGLVSKDTITEMEEEIKQLEKENYEKDKTIKELQERVSTKDSDLRTELEIKNIKISELEKRIERISGEEDITRPPGERGNVILSRNGAIETMKNLIENLKSTAMIFIPTIDMIDNLNLNNIKKTARVKLATYVDPRNQKHIDLYNKYSSMGNLQIKSYEQKDLWAINKDLEVLMFAPIGNDNSIAGLTVQSENQIDFFASILNSSWTARSKSVNI
ncbi:MAG: hypothetical protein GF329_03480 [Candidatus Lokiarchaeota archaeon]|nr:hypothetical protein [Candidatus Lokiarchaeota archaeon]